MALQLPDKWIWDFWLAQDGPDYHVFYLQAPRSLGDPELRHWNASIGHAVSQDLRTWRVLPDALQPGSPSDWDDYTTWTGSVLRHEALWYLFYTGTNRVEKGLVQRIGLATSSDLIGWDRYPENPILVADSRWYELLDTDLWHDQAWRDPWVFRSPDTGDFHALVTARANHGPADGRGVIAHARSDDLFHWEVLPPVTKPGDFGHMEVPQWVAIQGRYYLLFSSTVQTQAAARQRRTGSVPVTGTHYLVSKNPLGPFRYKTQEFLVGDPVGTLYAGKLIQAPGGEWVFMATRLLASDGAFVGELGDPLPVTIDGAGNLSVDP